MPKTLFIISLFALLAACNSWKPLKAPCTYDSRGSCGPVVPMEQKADSRNLL